MSRTFDEVVEASWAVFEERLGECLRGTTHGHLQIDPVDREEGAVPYVTVEWDDELLEADLVGLSADDDFRALHALGWRPSERREEHPFWGVTLAPDEVEVLAGMVSGTLRCVFGVADPAFLDGVGTPLGPGIGSLPGEARAVEKAEEDEEDEEDPERESAGPVGFPEDAADLTRMVEHTLELVRGTEVVRDDDGDFPIRCGQVLIWVRVQERSPVVQVFSYLVRSVPETRQVRTELGILNRRTPLLKFTLEEGVLVATAEMLAAPFVGAALLNTLDLVGELLNDLIEDTALRLGGKQWLDGLDVEPTPEQ